MKTIAEILNNENEVPAQDTKGATAGDAAGGLKTTATTVEKEQTQPDAGTLQTETAASEKGTTAGDKVQAPPKHDYAGGLLQLMSARTDTPEQRLKAAKRERTNNLIRSIGDGLSALSRLYFASQGGAVAHDNRNDLTAVSDARRKMLATAEENRQKAYINGYVKALQLDEEARKNDMTNAELIRYHNMIDKNNDNKDKLGHDKLDQKTAVDNREQDRKDRKQDYYEDNEDRKYELDKWYKENKIAVGKIRAAKTGGKKSSGSTSETARASDRIAHLYETDPTGLKEAEKACKKISRNWTLNTVQGMRQILRKYDEMHGQKKKGRPY